MDAHPRGTQARCRTRCTCHSGIHWDGTFGGCIRLGQVQREDWPGRLLASEPCDEQIVSHNTRGRRARQLAMSAQEGVQRVSGTCVETFPDDKLGLKRLWRPASGNTAEFTQPVVRSRAALSLPSKPGQPIDTEARVVRELSILRVVGSVKLALLSTPTLDSARCLGDGGYASVARTHPYLGSIPLSHLLAGGQCRSAHS